MSITRTLLIGLAFALTATQLPAQDQKLPEPDQAALARAEGLIKGLYRSEFASKFATELRELTIKLINKALETRDDHAARFVLYREAAECAARAGDFAGALVIIEELRNEFDVEIGSIKVRLIKAAANSTVPISPKPLGEAALMAVPDAFATNDPAIAEVLLKIASTAASKAKSVEMQSAVNARREDLKEVVQRFAKYQTALETVQKSPGDAEANLTVGKYACFVKGDWKRGLTHLSKSNDLNLRALASRDLAKPDDVSAQVELADAWWDQGEAIESISKRQAFGRAAFWYAQAMPKLQGLTLSKAGDRVTSTSKLYPGLDYGVAVGASVYAPFVGLWEIRYSDNGVRRYIIDNRGIVYLLSGSKVYRARLTPSGEQFFLAFGGVHKNYEKLIIKDGELLLEHIHPPRIRKTAIGKKRDLPENRPGGAIPNASSFQDIAGIWLATQSDKTLVMFIFGAKGSCVYMTQDGALEGLMSRKEDHIILDCNDDKIIRIKPVADGLRMDLHHPASTYPDSEPKVVATAIRLSK